MQGQLKVKKSLRMSTTQSGCASKPVVEAEQEETMSPEAEEVVVIVAEDTTVRTAKTEVRAAAVVVEIAEEAVMENIAEEAVDAEEAAMENMVVVEEVAVAAVQE